MKQVQGQNKYDWDPLRDRDGFDDIGSSRPKKKTKI